MDTKRRCKIVEEPNATEDIIFLHGFTSSREMQYPMAKHFENKHKYNIIRCDARGHGSDKSGDKGDWAGTINDINELIANRSHNTILIGHSMGGTMAITIGISNPLVKKVFAVGAVHGREMLTDEKIAFFSKRSGLNYEEKYEILIGDALPSQTEQCKDGNNEKFYLIHAKQDTIVPFDQFEANKRDLCLNDENTLVYDEIIPSKLFNEDLAHIIPFYKKETLDFIEKSLENKPVGE